MRTTTGRPVPPSATNADRTVAPHSKRIEHLRTTAGRPVPRARSGHRSNSSPAPRSGSNTCAPPPTDQAPRPQWTPIEQLPHAPERIEHIAPHNGPTKPCTGSGRLSNSCPRVPKRIEHLRPAADRTVLMPTADAERTVAPRPEADRTPALHDRPTGFPALQRTPIEQLRRSPADRTLAHPHLQRTPIEQLPRAPEADRTLALHHRPTSPRACSGRLSNSCPARRSGSNTCAPPLTHQSLHPHRTPIEQLLRAPKRIEHLRPTAGRPIPTTAADTDRTVTPRPEVDRTLALHDRPTSFPARNERRSNSCAVSRRIEHLRTRTCSGRLSNSCPAPRSGSNTCAPPPGRPIPTPAADTDRTVTPRPEADRTPAPHHRPTRPRTGSGRLPDRPTPRSRRCRGSNRGGIRPLSGSTRPPDPIRSGTLSGDLHRKTGHPRIFDISVQKIQGR